MMSRILRNRLWRWPLIASVLSSVLLAGCAGGPEQPTSSPSEATPGQGPASSATATKKPLVIDTNVPAMGKSSGVYYEIFVRSFSDSNGDGIGDLRGIANKLDYLKELGIKGIWLMPINPSPSYHGYDVTDYYSVNPDYGSLDDLKDLLAEAHKRGIKIIMDLVVNHTSSKHPWFVDSAQGKDGKYRNWYTWAEDQGMDTTSMGPWGQTVWHPSGGSSYLGIFSDAMPDLNLDNPEVRKEMIKIGQYWLKLGLDGFRLDAAKHVYEDFRASSDDPRTWANNKKWWQEFGQGMLDQNKDVYMVGEVWDSMTIVGNFLDKEFQSSFNFDLYKLILDSAKSEQAGSIGSFMSKALSYYSKQSNGQFVDAPFIGNHDQNRVMSEVNGDVNRARMAASILLTMPGNPFLYYGDEIGMEGSKPDERIREPMIWAPDRNSEGQTTWEAAESNEHTASVEEQLRDPGSLLHFYKMLISWRNEEPVLADGGIAPFDTENAGALGYVRMSEARNLLVVHNLTKNSVTVDLNANGEAPFKRIKRTTVEGVTLTDGKLQLPPYSTAILD